MNLRDKLIEAEYVHRGDDGPYLGEQCGFSCDHCTLIDGEKSGRPSYRICEKFKIKVGMYDSCKYYSDKEFSENCLGLARAIGLKTEKEKQAELKKQENSSSGAGCALGILVAIAVVVYLILR